MHYYFSPRDLSHKDDVQKDTQRPTLPKGTMTNTDLTADEENDLWRKALAHLQQLERSIDKVSRMVQSNSGMPPTSTNMLHDVVDEAKNKVQGLKSFFSALLGPTPYTEIRSSYGGCPAQRVFDVPELLEMILLQLPIYDILKFQRVNRLARDTIETSPALQQHLSFRPDAEGSPLRMPFNDVPSTGWCGFSCGPADRYHPPLRLPLYEAKDAIAITANFVYPKDRLPRIGSRWRRMYII